jgi:putative phosphoesterase
MTRLGAVGDIHGNLAGLCVALNQMGRIDGLLFTGDGFRDLSQTEAVLNVAITGVAGNCDFKSVYPAQQVIMVAGYRILITHGHLYGVKQGLTRLAMAGHSVAADLVVFGHTHQPLDELWQNVRLFNPGSLMVGRSNSAPSYGLIELDQKGIRTTLFRLQPEYFA